MSIRKLNVVREAVGDCKRCGLHETRQNIVFGRGSPNAPVMFVGEGPGKDEDAQGEPFVGRAGKLLDKMVDAMGFHRDDVYVANIVKCRPAKPGEPDRAPSEEEMATCSPYLHRQIAAVSPYVVVALGRVAMEALTPSRDSMSKSHGKIFGYTGPLASLPVVVTYHPAFLLRQPSGKAYARRDLKVVLRLLAKEGVLPPRKPTL